MSQSGRLGGSARPIVIALTALLLLAASAALGAGEATAAAEQTKRKGSDGRYEGPRIPTPNARRCDFLETSVCLHPWPNNLYTERDPATASGRRVAIDQRSMPTNAAGTPIDATDHNRNDGFSPGQAIVLHIDGLDNPAAFRRSRLVSIDDPRAYRDRRQRVVVINARTKKRHPIFAELDANPSADADRNLIIRPLRNWEEGGRYIVALRKLKDAAGERIAPPDAFRVYRDRLATGQRKIERRRGYFERRIFRPIKRTPRLGRRGLYMAWDFSVASAESLAERVLAMRDDAFARLGDTDLADLEVEGDAPAFTVTDVEDNPNAEILKRVKGTLDDVPCYLDTDGCPPGAKFDYDSKAATMPSFDPTHTVDVPFQCDVPNSVVDGGSVDPARPALYGHGLLGSRSQAGSSYVRDFGNNHNLVHCAVDWAGFAEEDVLPVILPSLTDVSRISAAFDRMQQGFVNFMILGRAMIHPQGFVSDPAFRHDAGSGSERVINVRRLYFYGNSQGGIMGGALTALAPDFKHSVLGVPGMNYSTLLRRSVDFDAYSEIPGAGLYDNYPNERERPLLLGLMQMLWDRGEANGYAHHMSGDPYPNTPAHNVLLHPALGDHQVANITAEVEARTIGARVLRPALDPGRHWERDPFMQIARIRRPPVAGSALVYWDGGPVGFVGVEGMGTAVPPNENVPPREENGFGEDPHSYPRKAPVAQQQMSRWLRPNGMITVPCPPVNGPCYANGYTGP